MKTKWKTLALFCGLALSPLSSAIEIQIKANELNQKNLILGSFSGKETLKLNVYNTLSEFNNLKVSLKEEKCKNVSKHFETSYYCVDLSTKDGVTKGSVYEKFGNRNHAKTNFHQVLEDTKDKKIAYSMSNMIYKSIFNKETVLNKKLAYVQRKSFENGSKIFNLKVSDYKGKDSVTLLASPQPIMSIAWSPDNKKLAYVSYEKVRSNVFIQDLETGARKRVTSFKGINAFPSWSPNGQNIALSLSKDGSSDIYIYNLAKNHLKKITDFKYEATEPVWISNTELVFTSDRSSNPYLYSLNLKTKKIKELSKDFLYSTSAKMNNKMDKAYSIFSKSGTSGILEINVKNREERILVTDFFAESPSVGAGDETIIYSTKKKDKSILRAVDLEGKIIYEINSAEIDLKEPANSN